ncbi:MAG: alpha/beta hydrolase [Ignavibacteriales bacterium]|nr:alpha/beta hydrolase [Ignavibacteriales bacterium]
MKRLVKYIALFSILFYSGANNFLFAQENQKKEEKKFTSLWEGKLKFGAVALRIVIKTFKNDDGSNGAFMDSPDQSVNNIPVENVLFTEDSLKFESKTIGAKYIGAAVKDSMIIRGNFTQRGMTLPLELKKIDKLVEIKRPQNPQKPYPYNDEEVTFENKSANITLAGSFTYPKGNGKFHAVVLVTGSGPQDRDESLMNHKPFLVISDYLTRNGIAVLRFDDRGIGKSKGNFAIATSEDFATDALAAVEYLKTRKEVDPKKIGIAGHSEGGLIAPMCAVNSSDVHFIVMIAGPGVSGREILLLQAKLINQASGESEEKIIKGNQLSEKIYDIVLNESDNDKAEKKIRALYDEIYPTLTDAEKKEEDTQKPMMDQQIKQILSPWFRFFLKYDPRPTLENVTVPVLAINGGKDFQVDPKQNLPEIEKALKAGGNKNFKIVEMPGLNHLFQKCKTCTITEYGELEETFSEDALKIMKDWILLVTK